MGAGKRGRQDRSVGGGQWAVIGGQWAWKEAATGIFGDGPLPTAHCLHFLTSHFPLPPMPLTVQTFVVSPFAENTLVVHDGTEAALVDPGTATREERAAVEAYVAAVGLRVRHLLLTHGHLDHVFGCAHFAGVYGRQADRGGWQMHEADEPLLAAAVAQGELYGVRVDTPPAPTHRLAAGDEVALGEHRFRVLHVPGHSPGSVAFYSAADGLVIGGDVLFRESVGRTDLWGGDTDLLLASIRRELFALPDETRVVPGHGPATTVGHERVHNPFLREPGARPHTPPA